LVLIPWVALIIIHFKGVKKILVGIEGIKICSAVSSRLHKWGEISSAVVQYDPDLNNKTLSIEIYGKTGSKTPLEKFNVSAGNSVVRARRHFLKNLLAYIDNTAWRANPNSLYSIRNNVMEPVLEEPVHQESNKAA
jgi:hypothetical protein